MNKGLEALQQLYNCVRCENGHNLEVCSSARETIEQELKERDEFELKYAKTHVALCKSREENSNEKQALKIIKKKKVDVRAFIEIFEKGWTWEQYMEEENDKNTCGHQFSNDKLTQEEFNLLKEVML